MEYSRVLLAVNTHSRRGAEMQHLAREQLERCGHEVIVCESKTPDEMTQRIIEARGRADAVAVGGGDGTLVSAIPGLLESRLPLVILPLGTFNELARTLQIPSRLDEACPLIEKGRQMQIDVGVVNGKHYFNEASVGISTRIARSQTKEIKRRLGPLAMPVTTIRAIPGFVPFHVDIEMGDERFRLRTMQVTIANSHRFGGVVENPDAAIDDAMLDLYSFAFDRVTQAIPIVTSVLLRRFPDVEGVKTWRAPAFRVTTRRPRHVFTDGEPATKTPADFSVLPKAVTVIVSR